MKIAIIPTEVSWISNQYYPDKWMRFADIENILASRGDGSFIKLARSESDIIDVDWIMFIGWYAWSYKWFKRVLKNKLCNKTVYWMLEPEVVNKQHSLSGAKRLLRKFKYIMTWNHDLISLERVFWQNISYNWKLDIDYKNLENNIHDMKLLLTNISGNKKSNVKGELYSERYKVIKWFENHHSEEFIFYGNGWDKSKFRTYGGACIDKKEVYEKFKFALCIENVSQKDYISEKIIDCLTAGIVPIYKGAENITDYIPEGCLVDYNKFNNINELYLFIKNMSDKEYNKYIHNIRDFVLNTDEISIFSAQDWVDSFDYLSRCDKGSPFFKISFGSIFKFYMESIVFSMKLLRHRLIDKIFDK